MVAVCTPTRGEVHSGFAYDLVRLVQTSDVVFGVSQGTLLPNQRTELVRSALGASASHILFIDSDMRFPADTVERLLKHDADIVGANCRHRQADRWTAGESSEGETGTEQIVSIGFGVTLIKASVFKGLPQPWFATPYDGKKFIGEDVFFCKKATDAGFKILVDHDLSHEVKHIGSKEL